MTLAQLPNTTAGELAAILIGLAGIGVLILIFAKVIALFRGDPPSRKEFEALVKRVDQMQEIHNENKMDNASKISTQISEFTEEVRDMLRRRR